MSETDPRLLAEQLDLLGAVGDVRAEICAPHADVELSTAPAGGVTLRWRGRWLHSRHDPQKEAQRQVAEIQAQIASEQQLLVFFGAGLGYVLAELCAVRANPCVWLEPFAAVAGSALAVTDLRAHLRNGRLALVTGVPDDDALRQAFAGRGNRDIVFIPHRPSYAADPAYSALQKRVEQFLNRKDVNLATMARFDRAWARNLIQNLPRLARAQPVARLFGCAQNLPAVVCGAGPSLGSDAPRLRELRDRFVLIAVDTALAVLQKHGIDPDFVVSVDPQPINRYFLEGYDYEHGRALFLADPTTCYPGLRLVPPERLYFAWSPFPLAKVFFDYWRETIGEIAFGGSVSTNAYDLAIKLGCTKIVLVGQDLSFTGGQAHARGAVLEERLNFRECRTFRREQHNYRQLSALPTRRLPGRGGGEVPANDKLVIFYQWFERRFPVDARRGIEIMNATSRGVRFAEDSVRPLASLEELRSWPVIQFTARPRPPAQGGLDASALYARLNELAGRFADFAERLAEGAELSRRLYDLARTGRQTPEYTRMLEAMRKIDENTRAESEMTDIAGTAMQRVIFQITENFRRELSPEEEADPHLSSARQSVLLYEALSVAARDHAAWLGKAVRRSGRL